MSAYTKGLLAGQAMNANAENAAVTDTKSWLGVLANGNYLNQQATDMSTGIINNTLSDEGYARLLKQDENGNYVNAGLISKILNTDPVATSYTDEKTQETRKGKVAGLVKGEQGTNLIIDTPQGFFPKTLGLTNKQDDMVANFDDTRLKELLNQAILGGAGRTKGPSMIRAGSDRANIEILAGKDQDDYGQSVTEVNNAIESGDITPKEGADIRAAMAEERIALEEKFKTENPETSAEVSTETPSGFIGLDEAKKLLKKSKSISTGGSGPRGGNESFTTTITNDPKYRNYIPDPEASNPFGLSDEEMDQLTVGERNSLAKREKFLTNTNINRVVSKEIKSIRNELRDLGSQQITMDEQSTLEKLGKAAGINPSAAGKYLPADFINNKNLNKTKNFFKENPAEFKKFVENPREYLTGSLTEETPNSFNLKNNAVIADTNKKFSIPEVPTNDADLPAYISEHADKFKAMGTDPAIVEKAQAYVKKYKVTDQTSFNRAPIIDNEINISKYHAATAIAENAQLTGENYSDVLQKMLNLGDTGVTSVNRDQRALNEASIANTDSTMKTRSYDLYRKRLTDQNPDFSTAYDYILDIDFVESTKNEAGDIVSGEYKNPNENPELISDVRNAWTQLRADGINGVGVTYNKEGSPKLKLQSKNSLLALNTLHGEYFLSIVEGAQKGGPVDFPDRIADLFLQYKSSNNPSDILSNVRVQTEIKNKRRVIKEIYFVSPGTGSEQDQSIKLPELQKYYGGVNTPFRQSFLALMNERKANKD